MTEPPKGETLETKSSEEQIEELRTLHHELDLRLQQIDSHISLTTEEQIERKEIQKKKLFYKDQIALLLGEG